MFITGENFIKELHRAKTIRHGMYNNRIYKIWIGMKNRCTNKSNKDYNRYGGRGIGIHTSWLNFDQFFKDMGESYRDGLEIDRIDNNKGYCKENCRWVTRNVNNANNFKKRKTNLPRGVKSRMLKNGKTIYYASISINSHRIYLASGYNIDEIAKIYNDTFFEWYGQYPSENHSLSSPSNSILG